MGERLKKYLDAVNVEWVVNDRVDLAAEAIEELHERILWLEEREGDK